MRAGGRNQVIGSFPSFHRMRPTQPQLAGLKLLARTEQVLAAGEAATGGWDDMLMLDSDDHVISSSRANLFLLCGEKVATPCLDRCGIAGTRRELLLTELLPAMERGGGQTHLAGGVSICRRFGDHQFSIGGYPDYAAR